MMDVKKLLHGTMLLTVGQVASYGLSFARNVILARMLTKADFGLAAVFGMTLTLLELAGRMSFGQQIIQSKHGDTECFLSTSHTFQFALSMAGALLMAALSFPLACAFHLSRLTWAFALLAAVPFARGFENLDYYRQQRHLNYFPAVLRELVPQAIVTLAAWPLVMMLGDFRAVIWLMLGKASMGILMTHWLSGRPYRWAWQTDYVRMMWGFGWPLLLNGLLMFASQQADQVVVGSFLSLDELALYALVLSVVSIPWFIFGQVGTSIMLPILSRVQDDSTQFRKQYRTCVAYAGVGSILFAIPLIVAGEQLISLLFGPKYHGAGPLMAILGATSAVRFLRFAPSVAAMARADTLNELFTHMWRSVSLPIAIIVAFLGASMLVIACCGLCAEIIATLYSLLRLRRRQGVPLRDTAGVMTYIAVFVISSWMAVFLGAPRLGLGLAATAVLSFLLVSFLVAFVMFPHIVRPFLASSQVVEEA